MVGRVIVAAALAMVMTASCGDDGIVSSAGSAGEAGANDGANDAAGQAGAGAGDAGGLGGSGGAEAMAGRDAALGGGPSSGGVVDDGNARGGEAGSGGAEEEPPKPPVESCAAPENEARWANGKKLYVGVNAQCGALTPCFDSVFSATYAAAKNGDTIVLLPGVHGRDIVNQTKDLSELRITSLDRDTTSVEGAGIIVTGEAGSNGELWIDHLTFRNSGPRTSSIEDGWGIHVTSWANADVRIQDNVFVNHSGRGGLGLESSTSNVSFHATVARNVFMNNAGEDAALLVSVPSTTEDYCFRIENNLIANNTQGVLVVLGAGEASAGTAELVNNTIARNEQGLLFSALTKLQAANNIIFDNDADLEPNIEIGYAASLRNNLLGSGQFAGVRGNFSADPLFVDADSGDFRLLPGSPAQARGTVLPAPDTDISGAARGYRPDLGAYERARAVGQGVTGLSCGDHAVQWGAIETPLGNFRGFETCDDGNHTNGDGCSEFCQREATPPPGRISYFAGNLCVVRQNMQLDCWGNVAKGIPSGSFVQVAVNQYYACALRDDGSVPCWLEDGLNGAFMPSGKYQSISSDGTQTCGVKADGSIACWNDEKATLSHDGSFVQVATNVRVCGLSALGLPTCWDPYGDFPPGPFVQIFSDRYGGCGLSKSGELTCIPNIGFFVEVAPDAAFQRAYLNISDGLAVRPDGRVAHWHANNVDLPVQDRPFIDAVGAGSVGCGLSADDKVYCWGLPPSYPRE